MLGTGGKTRRRRALVALLLAAAAIGPAASAFAQTPPDGDATTTTTIADTPPTTTLPAEPATTTTEVTAPPTTPVAPVAPETVEAPSEPVAEVALVADEPPAAVEVVQAVAGGYYQAGYSDTIYAFDGTTARPIGFAEWQSAGFPTPAPAPTEYVKYWWSPTIYAVTKWNTSPSTWQWEALSFGQWSRAGYPSPAAVDHVPGSYYYKWGTSDSLFVEGPDGVNHQLTAAEWAASGQRTFDDRRNEGFVKLTWSDSIAFMPNLGGGGGLVMTFDQWRNEGFPTPWVATRLPGDRFVQYVGSSTIYYEGPTMSGALSFAEWQAAGSPAPSIEVPPVPANSGSGRRIVYSRPQQRVWAIEADGTIVKTHLVSGRLYEPYAGTYSVYSRSMYTYSTENANVRWRYMVRFAYGPGGGRIGFHEIPNKNGVPMQSYSQLGQPLSGGCVRQTTADAVWMWDWAQLGTTVVVL